VTDAGSPRCPTWCVCESAALTVRDAPSRPRLFFSTVRGWLSRACSRCDPCLGTDKAGDFKLSSSILPASSSRFASRALFWCPGSASSLLSDR